MPPFLNAIIDWLRAGYPDGVPESDYIPLLALLRRRLSEDEVRQIAAELAGSGDLPADKTDIQVLITKVTNEMPSEADVARVQTRLEAHAWPQDGSASVDDL
ncbi:hypothetical protein NBRGN_036_00330 [Nocardia brasiliensis NBRC 14402]|uniref:DUF3349 domain-containing protein n=1 Tax=Nocardia brasiliensis TaxID=37326 RepID=UPI0002F5A562|nr:DUF3349 domain-containing protein [Nocardia brasiliensis]ASF11252.1 DUF3349 domain-containing protein [Nocardia brasiliensis]GAJ81201.1 hypothetical protein NBRGN_036_00330 [Nocardia brasiliensis NBRC 14402]SUB10034.1 Protein of uncharacterised function (DUF3349) [Nocardia brasiliensis]